jgi:zinc protease
VSLEVLAQAMAAEMARLRAEGPTPDEMVRGLAQAEAQFVYRLQTVGGFSGKSDQLNAYNVFVGDPGFFERDLARYQSADATALRRAGERWLDPARCVALSVVPHGRQELALSHSVRVEAS